MTSNQTDHPPPWGTPAYWAWVKDHYLSTDPAQVGRVMSKEAEYGRAYALARRGANGLQHADAEEAAQEYCIALLGARDKYDPRRSVSAYFNGILSKKIAAQRRKVGRDARVLLAAFDEGDEGQNGVGPPASTEGTPLDEAMSTEEMTLLLERVDGLSDDDRAILLLLMEQTSARDIAEMLGVAVGTMHVRIFRARARLHALISQHGT